MYARKSILAGLIAAIAFPVIASAAPTANATNVNPRRTPEPLPKEFFLLHKQAMDRGVSHIEASERAAQALKTSASTGHDAQWSLRHKQAMDRGLTHIDASMAADKE